MTDKITSAQNPRIKDLLNLQTKSRERKSRGLFVVEGRREVERALSCGFMAEAVYYCSSKGCPEGLDCPQFEVSQAVYDKIAYREGTEGIVALMRSRSLKLEDIDCSESPLFMVLEAVEKPGNIGAVLRTADAAGVDAVIICNPLTDLYNPNLIRSSLGAVFSVPMVECSSEMAIEWLKKNKIQILTAQLQDSQLYYDLDMKRPTAIVFGAEDKGLSNIWRENSDARIRIPMAGLMDSLNVSVSAAILCFEAVRQRNSVK